MLMKRAVDEMGHGIEHWGIGGQIFMRIVESVSMKGSAAPRHFVHMKALWIVPLCLAANAWGDEADDRAAIQKTVATFNDTHLRSSVLAHDADVGDLSRYGGQEVSQVYFEVKTVRMVTAEVAVADATGSQFGSLIMKRSAPAVFVLKRESGEWRVALLRISGPCL